MRFYTSLVQRLILYDELMAEAKADLIRAEGDEEARQRASKVIEMVRELQQSVEDDMRKIEPGER